jgi:hypothetical protein
MTLKADGSDYILDLASAQYGHYQPIVPLMECIETRMGDGGTRSSPFGHMKTRKEELSVPTTPEALITRLNVQTSEKLLMRNNEWEGKQQLTPAKMLRKPIQEFETERAAGLGDEGGDRWVPADAEA